MYKVLAISFTIFLLTCQFLCIYLILCKCFEDDTVSFFVNQILCIFPPHYQVFCHSECFTCINHVNDGCIYSTHLTASLHMWTVNSRPFGTNSRRIINFQYIFFSFQVGILANAFGSSLGIELSCNAVPQNQQRSRQGSPPLETGCLLWCFFLSFILIQELFVTH